MSIFGGIEAIGAAVLAVYAIKSVEGVRKSIDALDETLKTIAFTASHAPQQLDAITGHLADINRHQFNISDLAKASHERQAARDPNR